MDTDTNTQSYRDILRNIGEHLKSRQKLILKRTGLISGPLTVTAVPLIYGGKLELEGNAAAIYFSTFFILTFLAFWWAIILGQIFKIERVIWIDSFFDKVPLDDKQSWRLARKLFWPSVVVNIISFLRYYVIPLVLYPIIVLWYIWYWQNVNGNIFIFLGIAVGGLIALWVYFYLLKIRLRYVHFLLVDTYSTPGFSYGKLYSESKTLNRTIKTDDFKRLFVTTIGTDVVGEATNFAIGTVIGAVSRNMGVGGKMAGAMVEMYSAEVVSTNKKLAQTVTFYLYYRVARATLGKNEQTVNSALYNADSGTRKPE